MCTNVLNSQGRNLIARLANDIFHGEDSSFDIDSSEPAEVEAELEEMVGTEGFETIVPSGFSGGTSRMPYLIPNHMLSVDGDYVVKFARYKRGGESGPEKGRIQNECEVRVWNELNENQRQFFVPVRDSDPHYFWIVMDYAEVFEECNGELQRNHGPEEMSNLMKNMEDSGVKIHDPAGNLGYHEGEIKCLDYGIKTQWYRGFSDKEEIIEEFGNYDSEQPYHLDT